MKRAEPVIGMLDPPNRVGHDPVGVLLANDVDIYKRAGRRSPNEEILGDFWTAFALARGDAFLHLNILHYERKDGCGSDLEMGYNEESFIMANALRLLVDDKSHNI